MHEFSIGSIVERETVRTNWDAIVHFEAEYTHGCVQDNQIVASPPIAQQEIIILNGEGGVVEEDVIAVDAMGEVGTSVFDCVDDMLAVDFAALTKHDDLKARRHELQKLPHVRSVLRIYLHLHLPFITFPSKAGP